MRVKTATVLYQEIIVSVIIPKNVCVCVCVCVCVYYTGIYDQWFADSYMEGWFWVPTLIEETD